VVGVPLTREQEARVRLTIASMFVSPDIRADNARQALALPSLPDDLRHWPAYPRTHEPTVLSASDGLQSCGSQLTASRRLS
jgi:hypothetical protein